ncbi:MAG: alkaline phosphatase family protein [Tepidisphaeraceae bacterium]
MKRVVLCLLVLIGCAARPAPQRTVVVWVSVDGLRGDYVERADLSFLKGLAREGAFTTRLVPVFPSLTFSSHASQITGATVLVHGVPSNSFFDERTGKSYSFPDEAALFQCDPLWVTCAKQHVRSAVIDWPMSFNQPAPFRADYFNLKYDKDATDAQRLSQLIRVWQQDCRSPPLRLLIGYVHRPDTVAHKYGPDSAETMDAVRETDALLAAFHRRCIEVFEEKMGPQDELYFIVTTDHGMSPLRVQANLERMLGDAFDKRQKLITSGSVGNIYLSDVPEPQRMPMRDAILTQLRTYEFAEVFARDELPVRWQYAHPTRVGEVVVSLRRGYTFTSRKESATRPVPTSGPLGMHGYAAEQNPEMLGFAVIWRYRRSMDGSDLGEVDSRRLAPTVAGLLHVAPPANATGEPLRLPVRSGG